MYTQCPECQIAFRVTAKVLQQAAGNVRCGSCGHAFSALEYLSEEMPEHAAPAEESAADTEQSVDELAETSKRLLQTLDELAGPDDVRIEDTGVEWRVMDAAAAADVKLSPDEIPPEDEIRYDDNTPLPDDFGEDDSEGPLASAPAPQRRTDDYTASSDEFEERQGDLALSEPDEWTDILEEVRDPGAETLAVEEELAAIHTELSAIDEALTDEVPQLDEEVIEAGSDDEPDELEADLIEQIEAGAAAELAEDVDDDLAEEHEEDAVAAFGADDEEESGSFEAADIEIEAEGDEDEDADDLTEEREEDAAAEFAADDEEETGSFEAADIEIEAAGDEDDDAEVADELASLDSDPDSDLQEQLDELEMAMAAKEDADAADGDETVDESGELEVVAADDGDEETSDEASDQGEFSELDEDDVEESFAADEDESTEDDESGADIDEEQPSEDDDDDDAASVSQLAGLNVPEGFFDENSGEVETIIMEGEFVRSEIEQERLAAENDARNQMDDSSSLLDTYALQRGKVRGGRRSYDPPSSVVIGAIVVLGALLIGQLVHNFRQPLATYGFFNATIAPVYRMLGSPITPDWDIKGWQFEATNGSVDDEETTLTIVSRIVNRSEQDLPYPLVHVSLTNRFEDVMGSRILEPGEYLAGDDDPSRPVAPGENFSAVITVEDPSVDATGFKLNVCYRVAQGTVRCAIEDFKN